MARKGKGSARACTSRGRGLPDDSTFSRYIVPSVYLWCPYKWEMPHDLTPRSQQPRSLLQNRDRLFSLRRRHTEAAATRLHRFQHSRKQQRPSALPRSRPLLFIRRLGSRGDCRCDCCRGGITEKNREAQGHVGHGPLCEGDARQLYRSHRGVRFSPPSVALCTLSSRSKERERSINRAV